MPALILFFFYILSCTSYIKLRKNDKNTTQTPYEAWFVFSDPRALHYLNQNRVIYAESCKARAFHKHPQVVWPRHSLGWCHGHCHGKVPSRLHPTENGTKPSSESNNSHGKSHETSCFPGFISSKLNQKNPEKNVKKSIPQEFLRIFLKCRFQLTRPGKKFTTPPLHAPVEIIPGF